MFTELIEWFVALVLALTSSLAPATDQADPNDIVRELGGCWEDEVVVLVIADVQPDNGVPPDVDWGPGGLTGTYGCVPADNLPVDGYRP